MSTISLTVLRLLADPARLNHDQIASEAGIERGAVGAQIRHLHAQSLIYRPNGGDWVPTKAGHALIDSEPETSVKSETTPTAEVEWTKTDQILCVLDEHPGGLTNSEVGRAMSTPGNKIGGYLKALGERGDAIKVGGFGGKWYAAWHAPTSEPETQAISIKAQVMHALEAHPNGISASQLGEEMGRSAANVAAHLCHIANEGRAVKVGNYGGLWYAAQHAPEPVAA